MIHLICLLFCLSIYYISNSTIFNLLILFMHLPFSYFFLSSISSTDLLYYWHSSFIDRFRFPDMNLNKVRGLTGMFTDVVNSNLDQGEVYNIMW